MFSKRNKPKKISLTTFSQQTHLKPPNTQAYTPPNMLFLFLWEEYVPKYTCVKAPIKEKGSEITLMAEEQQGNNRCKCQTHASKARSFSHTGNI